jgi:hypothetical protein
MALVRHILSLQFSPLDWVFIVSHEGNQLPAETHGALNRWAPMHIQLKYDWSASE